MKILKKFFSNKKVIITFLVIAFIIVFFLSIALGSVSIPLKDVFSALFKKNDGTANFRIVRYVRLPRTLGAVLAGAALAVSGSILQSVLNNRLASPGIVGINAGGGLFSLLMIVLFPSSLVAAPLGAFLGALIAVLTVWSIASLTESSKSTLILTGVAVSSLFTAIIDIIITINPKLQLDKIAFSIGGLENTDMNAVLYALPIFATGLIVSLLLSYDLNVLSLGDDLAAGLGMKTKPIRFIAMFSVALLAGSAISIAGLLGFVGLIAPHITAKLVGNDNRILFPSAAVFGALLTLVCDIIARTVFSPYELPVGILLSLIGAPFFLFLLLGSKRKRKIKKGSGPQNA